MDEAKTETAVAETEAEILPAISSTTSALPSVPSLTDAEAWQIPATQEDCQAAATHLLTATEMGLSHERRTSDEEKMAFMRLLAAYDYTRAELIYAMREVPRDPERFGGRGVTIQDVERIVRQSRTMRARLDQQIDEEALGELLAEFPDDLDREDFQCSGFNKFDEPLYRYAPELKKHGGPPRPVLEEKKRPKRRGNETADGDEIVAGLGEENESDAS
jgi:hypothetical protein